MTLAGLAHLAGAVDELAAQGVSDLHAVGQVFKQVLGVPDDELVTLEGEGLLAVLAGLDGGLVQGDDELGG